jgi:hypothetical protein
LIPLILVAHVNLAGAIPNVLCANLKLLRNTYAVMFCNAVDVQILFEGERSFSVFATSLRTFCARNLQKIDKFATGKTCKPIRHLYEVIVRTGGRVANSVLIYLITLIHQPVVKL